jgi:hypothetical protein
MLYFLLASILSLILSFTVVLLAAMGLRILILGFFLVFTGQQGLMRWMPRLQRPLDFFMGLAHGVMAIWTSKWLFDWLNVPANLSLGLFLLLNFLWYDINKIRQLPQKLEGLFDNHQQAAFLQQLSQQMGRQDEGNPFTQQFEQQQKQLLDNMRSSQIIQLIGRCTGLIIAGMNNLAWPA